MLRMEKTADTGSAAVLAGMAGNTDRVTGDGQGISGMSALLVVHCRVCRPGLWLSSFWEAG